MIDITSHGVNFAVLQEQLLVRRVPSLRGGWRRI
jgi:hypothetical protein